MKGAGKAVAGAMPSGGGGDGGGGGGATAPDGDMPVVEAFPLVEAEPTDGSEGAPAEGGEAPSARRLLAVPKPGYNAKAHIQSLDGYMLVHVPDTAAPGEVFKAKTPSGHIWAFKVPETLPKDRIIKLHLPDLKAMKGGATLKMPAGVSLLHGKPLMKIGRMLDGEPPAEAALEAEVVAGNSTVSRPARPPSLPPSSVSIPSSVFLPPLLACPTYVVCDVCIV